MGSVPTPHIDLGDYLEYNNETWHDYSTNIEVSYGGSEISADPPECPLEAEISVTEAQFWPKILCEILPKSSQIQKYVPKKPRLCVPKNFFI